MNKVLGLGVMLTLSMSILTACGSGAITGTTSNLTSTGNSDSYKLSADTSLPAVSTSASPAPNVNGDYQMGNHQSRGGKGGEGFGGRGGHEQGGEGFDFKGLNLTADQQTQLKAIRDASKPTTQPVAPDQTKIDAAKKAFSDAFLATTFDATALKTALDSLKPVQDDTRVTAQANAMIKSYAVLTADQKQLLITNQKARDAAMPTVTTTPSPEPSESPRPNRMLDKLATDLTLTADQKTSLQAVLDPSTEVKPDFTQQMATRKANRDAINAELQTNNASVDKIVALLKAGKPDMSVRQTAEFTRLGKIHDILTADQRTKFVTLSSTGMGFGIGFGGGKGGHDQGGGRGNEGGRGYEGGRE